MDLAATDDSARSHVDDPISSVLKAVRKDVVDGQCPPPGLRAQFPIRIQAVVEDPARAAGHGEIGDYVETSLPSETGDPLGPRSSPRRRPARQSHSLKNLADREILMKR